MARKNTEKKFPIEFTYTTNERNPPISLIKVDLLPEILINLNDKKWILSNRESIVELFKNHLNPIIEKMIDDVVEELDEKINEEI